MKQGVLALLVVLLLSTGCGVRGEPSRRQDEVFIRESQVVKAIKEQSLQQKEKQEKKLQKEIN